MTPEIRHHLTDALLMAYAAGSLPEAFSLTVAAHISMCDECRARLGAYDAIGGALIEDGGAADMPGGSFAACLARARATPMVATSNPAPPGVNGVLPGPIRDYVGGDLDAVRWRPVGMGVRQAILRTDKRATARLLHIPAGTSIPDHGHHGTELTLVLQGAFLDATDRFGLGDIEVANEDLDHTPVADIGVDCICLTASDAPLRFHKLGYRIAQRFLRI